jgi:gamma-glutamylcyclotransferase (GGCT)/AIG2-like uncharacterized protein YtfP
MNTPSQSSKIFVYGTLKRGYCRASALSGQRFLGAAATAPAYRMFDCGSYPGLVESDEGLSIEGEVWEIDIECLQLLDDVEGVALNLYRRGRVKLLAPFDADHVQAYFYRRTTAGLSDCGPVWP